MKSFFSLCRIDNGFDRSRLLNGICRHSIEFISPPSRRINMSVIKLADLFCYHFCNESFLWWWLEYGSWYLLYIANIGALSLSLSVWLWGPGGWGGGGVVGNLGTVTPKSNFSHLCMSIWMYVCVVYIKKMEYASKED